MQSGRFDYDATIKSILQSLANSLTAKLTGSRAVELLSVEFESVERRVPDLVLRLEDERIFHLEIQSDNDPRMAQRMLRYRLLLLERFQNSVIVQYVLYIGKSKCSMVQAIKDGDLSYRYYLIDIRELSEDVFLLSNSAAERALALLTRVSDARNTIRRILASWTGKPNKEKADLEVKLVILSGLRKLEKIVREEIQRMPITIDLMENDVIREWIEGGIQKGIEQGLQQGTERGQSALLAKQLTRRFGALPAEYELRLQSAHSEQLEKWALRLLDASTLAQVFSE
jgi:predicted transposase/invertase (TIGR01784 family)